MLHKVNQLKTVCYLLMRVQYLVYIAYIKSYIFTPNSQFFSCVGVKSYFFSFFNFICAMHKTQPCEGKLRELSYF